MFFIPGTKWCGQGNAAENYHDLGVFNESDACCRDHDFCDDIIQSGRTKHNLINPYGTTRYVKRETLTIIYMVSKNGTYSREVININFKCSK